MRILERISMIGAPIASDRKGYNWAPKVFVRQDEAIAANLTIKMLDDAMHRLIKMGQIEAIDVGSGGRVVHKLVPKRVQS
jgi:hypothetical protein